VAIEPLGNIADTQVASGPSSVVLDFETGDTSNWTVNDPLVANQTRVYAGSYSGESDDRQATVKDPMAYAAPSALSGGVQASSFEFYWQETTNQRGGGVRLKNSNGNFEVGLATNNPQWDIDDGSGVTQVFSGDGEDRWIRFKITFDWGNSTFSTDFEDLQSGSTYSDTGRALKQGTDLERIELWSYTGGSWGSSADDLSRMWWDNFTVVL
jgi:hypothetical protein